MYGPPEGRRRARVDGSPKVSRASTIALIAFVLGCQSSKDAPGREPPPQPPRPAALSASPTSSATGAAAPPGPSAGVAAIDSAPAVTDGGAGELAGVWVGRYDAKKGTVALPPKVKDKGLASDQGTAAVGQGSIEVAILANGDVRGKMSGALGEAEITGKLDGGMVRAVVRPTDPYAAHAMTGIFVGERKGEALACELHVAGPDGTMIRESTVELARKK